MESKPVADRDRRGQVRSSLRVPFRMAPRGRSSEGIDGLTLDVSQTGLGVQLNGGPSKSLDRLLEALVDDRLDLEITLRLEEGSVSARGQLMWWGLLGEAEAYAIRGGILLPEGWNASDWELVRRHLDEL